MASKPETRVLTFSAINDFFINDINCIKNGENAYNSNNVLEFKFDGGVRIIKGVVQARMRKCKYDVMIYLEDDYSIEKATCSCPRGEFICHHMAALALHGHYNLSRTDVSCSWVARPTTAQGGTSKAVPILPNELFNPQAIGKENSVEAFKKKLKEIDHGRALLWLMAPEPENVEDNIIPYIQDVLVSEEFLNVKETIPFLEEKFKLTPEKILEVSEKTIGQVDNPVWLICRKNRLTASNFGVVIKAFKINSFPKSLFKSLAGAYNLNGVKQVQYGRKTEGEALKAFERKEGMEVQPAGLWLDTYGILGASPDGMIGEDGLIEIKCPYTHRDAVLEEVLTKKDILMYQNGEWVLNRNHDYFHQIQGQLYLAKKKFCKLVIYTSKSLVIYNIEKALEWEDNLTLLKKIYFEQYVPYILKN